MAWPFMLTSGSLPADLALRPSPVRLERHAAGIGCAPRSIVAAHSGNAAILPDLKRGPDLPAAVLPKPCALALLAKFLRRLALFALSMIARLVKQPKLHRRKDDPQ